MNTQRVRIRFAKLGDLRLLSHRDLVRAFERLFRRAGIELAMSQGFHPRPRMTFPDALALGIEGRDEVMDLSLAQPVEAGPFQALLESKCPPGLKIKQIELLRENQRKVKIEKSIYELSLPPHIDVQTLELKIQAFVGQQHLIVQRKEKQVELELNESLDGLWVDDGKLRMRIRVVQQSQLQPRDILAALGLDTLVLEGNTLTRTKNELSP
jgi:radical SAM-linked protein